MEEALVSASGLWKKFSRSRSKMVQYGVVDVLKAGFGLQGSHNLRKGEFWSLQDVNFSVGRGEVLGLCGHNGAGKTTLLKTLSGLLQPDRGSVTIRGNVGWLVDIGAGLNPLLTGWENVALRIDMLSMRSKKAELLAYIADFTELGEFLETPVGFYSSGMKAKLGFAISTMVHPDVLIIDETLAVGDLAFRMKCYDRISTISRTAAVLFVSHGMNHVSRICNRGVYMEGGKVLFDGDVQETIKLYNDGMLKNVATEGTTFNDERLGIQKINGLVGSTEVEIGQGQPLDVTIQSAFKEEIISYRVIVRDLSGNAVMETVSPPIRHEVEEPEACLVDMKLLGIDLAPGRYQVSCMADDARGAHVAVSQSRRISVLGAVGSGIAYAPSALWSVGVRN